MGAPSSPRQNYAVTTRVCCLCVNTSSRETERSERGRDRERSNGDGGAGCRAARSSCRASMPLSRKPRLFLVTGEGASAQFLAMAAPHADRRRNKTRRLGLQVKPVRVEGKDGQKSGQKKHDLLFFSTVLHCVSLGRESKTLITINWGGSDPPIRKGYHSIHKGKVCSMHLKTTGGRLVVD